MAFPDIIVSKRAIGFVPVLLLFVSALFSVRTLPSFAAFRFFRPAGLPRSFDGFTIADGFQKTPKMHD
jgi:hypothetical protein